MECRLPVEDDLWEDFSVSQVPSLFCTYWWSQSVSLPVCFKIILLTRRWHRTVQIGLWSKAYMYHLLQISPHMRCVLRKKQILCKPLYCRIDCHFIRTILRLRPRHHTQTNLSAFCSPAPQSGVRAVCHQQCTSVSCYPGLSIQGNALVWRSPLQSIT